MKATTKLLHTQGTLYTFSEDAHLESWIEAFLIDRKVDPDGRMIWFGNSRYSLQSIPDVLALEI